MKTHLTAKLVNEPPQPNLKFNPELVETHPKALVLVEFLMFGLMGLWPGLGSRWTSVLK